MTVSATQFPTKWCLFQPPRSKTVGGDTFGVAKSVLFRRGEKHDQNITKCNCVPNNNINSWYVVLILLHWWNNNNKKDPAKKNPLPNNPLPPPLPRFKKIICMHYIHILIKVSGNLILVCLLFLWFSHFYERITSPACPMPAPGPTPLVKIVISIIEK